MNALLTRCVQSFTDPRFTARLHLWLMALWIALIIPTLLWWKDSILWVLIISLYANIVGHWSSYQAVRAELNQGEASTNNDLTDDKIKAYKEELKQEVHGPTD